MPAERDNYEKPRTGPPTGTTANITRSNIMTTRFTDRRTVLKALGAGALGAAVSPGTATAGGGYDQETEATNSLTITGTHEHDASHAPGGHGKHRFELSTSEIAPGWATHTFDNKTNHAHFVYTVRVNDAESKLADYEGGSLREKFMNAVTFPFQEAWEPYYAGEIDAGTLFENLGAALPEWYLSAEVAPVGGPGLTAGKSTATTALNLQEGTYFAECYVLDDDGLFHSPNGMLASFAVTGDASKMAEPDASLDVAVSSTSGIAFDPDTVAPGQHTVRVTFEDNAVYGHGQGHDVHLLRLDRPEDLNVWLNWLDAGPDGFYADRGALTSTGSNPGPKTFLGGVQDVFPSGTAYMDVNLTPGRYAWVAEVPDPLSKGMLVPFTVGDGSDDGQGSA